MFDVAQRTCAKALGVNCSVIVRTIVKGTPTFWVFGREHIKKLYTRHRVPYKLDIEWPKWTDVEEDGGMVLQNAIETYTIGQDCVFFRPLPDIDSPFGLPFILPFWDAGVAKPFARYMHILYAWKGGILSKYLRYPDTLDPTTVDKLTQESRKGILSEGIMIGYPPGMSPENVDKMFQHDEVNGNDINWDELNSLLSQDTPFPKSFIDGQVESGALGGSAPEVDKQKEDETLFTLFQLPQQLIKDINTTFFDFDRTDYLVIPWSDDQAVNSTSTEEAGKATPTEGDAPTKPQESQKSNTIAKLNSVTPDGLYEYDAVLLPVGEWPYPTETDPTHTEFVDMETIRDYVDDPLTVREGYFHEEHPENPAEVLRDDALGKYKITGYDDRGMVGKIYSKTSLGKEFQLSNFYYSHDETTGEKTTHRRIDYRNAVRTRNPRMAGAIAKFT